jgi:hypothetical protein
MHDEDIATVIVLTLPDLKGFRERHGDENKNVPRSQRILGAPGSILLSVPSRMTNWWNNAAATCSPMSPSKTQAVSLWTSPSVCPNAEPAAASAGSGTTWNSDTVQPRADAFAQPISGSAISNTYSNPWVTLAASRIDRGRTLDSVGGL